MNATEAAKRYRGVYRKLYGISLRIVVCAGRIRVDFIHPEIFTVKQLNAMAQELTRRLPRKAITPPDAKEPR